MAANIEPTETNEELMDASTIEESMLDELMYYARKHGIGQCALTMGQLQARNAMKAGRSPAYAYELGREAMNNLVDFAERPINHWPISTAYNAAKSMGAVDLCTTATGVAGHYQHNGHWFRVKLDAVGSEPQMRLGE